MADGSRPLAGKFMDPHVTADGQRRAWVGLKRLETLWFNTGTLCNIQCLNCYILSSPKNDALVYLTADDVRPYLDEIRDQKLDTREIGFTGGEPFMNPNMVAMTDLALQRGFEVLILTNAMRPMMRPKIQEGLVRLIQTYGDKLTFRISLDHHSAPIHDAERGKGAFDVALVGMRWLRDQGARLQAAGRSLSDETEDECRAGFAALFAQERFRINADHPADLVLFPEMDEMAEVPEITTACWGILGKTPDSVMCSNTRMVVKRRGAEAPAVLACTLLAYDPQFELGATLADAARPVPLNHVHCAKFCVLGGAR
ncbi:MAG: radical SAM protein, partial [Pseudomonadota bacterium]